MKEIILKISVYLNPLLFLFSYLISPYRDELDLEIKQINSNGLIVIYLILGINLGLFVIAYFGSKSLSKHQQIFNLTCGIFAFLKLLWIIVLLN